MSATKRFYEDMTTTIATAIYNECLDMGKAQDTTLFEVEEDIMNEIANGNLEDIYNYMVGCLDHVGEDLMPKTAAAVKTVGEYLEIRKGRKQKRRKAAMTMAFNDYFFKHNDYYSAQILRYIEADKETREAAKAHWLKMHAENLKADREDLIIFSGKNLEAIMTAEAILAEQEDS